MNKPVLSVFVSFILLFSLEIVSQENKLSGVNAFLQNDTLTVENKLTKHQYLWNNGNLMLIKLIDKIASAEFSVEQPLPDFQLQGESSDATEASIKIDVKRYCKNENLFKEVTVIFHLEDLQIKRVIAIYEESPVIKHTFYSRGSAKVGTWSKNSSANLEMVENNIEITDKESRIAYLGLNDPHWEFKSVNFREATDYHDNPISENNFLGFRKKQTVQGNLLFASNRSADLSIFVLKEAPIGKSQQYYQGYDFVVDSKSISVHGLGIAPKDLQKDWVQGYGYAIGITSANEMLAKKALITYQKQLRKYIPKRDAMVLANTWGDRSKDSKMNEAFILKEIELATKLGITHLQLDDGWQQGLSKNSAKKAGKKWDDWTVEDWQPHKTRFPKGFRRIIKQAKKNGIEICLWFNPSKTSSYAYWERDADILLDYYKKFGIKVFKIDGMSLTDKQSEINLRNLFHKVMQETNGNVTFNMDVTAGNRMGYHYFTEFGNIFLENRYTDWANYYPHRTLRNLWLLSNYMPAERLQIEFLNPFRNKTKYHESDALSPKNVGIDYATAVSLMAQPLAWMELSGLPDEAHRIKDILMPYKQLANEIHEGVILPIGNEPSGFSWTGFISLGKEGKNYLLVFRENMVEDSFDFDLPIEIEIIKHVLGNETKTRLNNDGKTLKVSFEDKFSFGLFEIK